MTELVSILLTNGYFRLNVVVVAANVGWKSLFATPGNRRRMRIISEWLQQHQCRIPTFNWIFQSLLHSFRSGLGMALHRIIWTRFSMISISKMQLHRYYLAHSYRIADFDRRSSFSLTVFWQYGICFAHSVPPLWWRGWAVASCSCSPALACLFSSRHKQSLLHNSKCTDNPLLLTVSSRSSSCSTHVMSMSQFLFGFIFANY